MTSTADKEYSENHPDITILDPKIIVFHNVISDCEGYINFYETNLPWEGWYGFGDQVQTKGGGLQTESPEFPGLHMWNRKIVDIVAPGMDEDPYRQELARAFYKASKFYVEYTKHTQPNWVIMPWALAKYTPDKDIIQNDDLTMNYHTDYMPDDSDTPGNKFSITAVFYPNDNYGGGEISFRLLGDSGILNEIDYKPVAGDLVVFPSKHPYYHGVKRITGAPKYITRIYWMYNYPGSEDWFELRSKYGPEKFTELERQRRKRQDLMLMRPYMRPRFSLKEYYNLLETGELLPVYYEKLEDTDLD
jgi:hypothetical protein